MSSALIVHDTCYNLDTDDNVWVCAVCGKGWTSFEPRYCEVVGIGGFVWRWDKHGPMDGFVRYA